MDDGNHEDDDTTEEDLVSRPVPVVSELVVARDEAFPLVLECLARVECWNLSSLPVLGAEVLERDELPSSGNEENDSLVITFPSSSAKGAPADDGVAAEVALKDEAMLESLRTGL